MANKYLTPRTMEKEKSPHVVRVKRFPGVARITRAMLMAIGMLGIPGCVEKTDPGPKKKVELNPLVQNAATERKGNMLSALSDLEQRKGEYTIQVGSTYYLSTHDFLLNLTIQGRKFFVLYRQGHYGLFPGFYKDGLPTQTYLTEDQAYRKVEELAQNH